MLFRVSLMKILQSGGKRNWGICRSWRNNQSMIHGWWHMLKPLRHWKRPSMCSFWIIWLLVNILCRDALSALSQDTFLNFTGANFANGTLSQSSQANAKAQEAEQTRAHQQLLILLNHADETEQELGIEEQRTSKDLQYVDTLMYINNWTFIHVVECHEGLVVQQLFELLKANLATTGV